MSQENLFTAPAGWYPDPLGTPQLRWWNSQGWTEQVSDALAPTVKAEPQFAWKDDEPTASAGSTRATAATPVYVAPTLGQLEAPRAAGRVEDPTSYDAPTATTHQKAAYQTPAYQSPAYQAPAYQDPFPEPMPVSARQPEPLLVVPARAVFESSVQAEPAIPRYPETHRQSTPAAASTPPVQPVQAAPVQAAPVQAAPVQAAPVAQPAPSIPSWDVQDVDPYSSAPTPSVDAKDLGFWSASRPEDIRRQIALERERAAREAGQ